MRVLGIDPGPTESAYVLWDGKSILAKGKRDNNSVAAIVFGESVREAWIGIEMIASYGMAVGAETFETCVWIGRFMEASGSAMSVTRVTRKAICSHLCGSGKANDANIRQRLLDLVGPQGTKKSPGPTYGVSKDIWSALAVAITVYDQLQEGTYDKRRS